ncbi:MAG: histidine--tRNA ligase [Chitinophagaceae bacterium]
MTQPSLPKGFRDFGPDIVRKRNYILNTIRNAFELHGFQPLETPAMENLDTLLGKYGEEGDRLIFKVLNNGLGNKDKEAQSRKDFEKILAGKNSTGITERALKYDLTIPFARYVAMHHQQMYFPFKRYQIQPVWRADRPQKGRYREFYQCDADVVGSRALLNEIELIEIYHDVFNQLGLSGTTIKFNHRQILVALAKKLGNVNLLTTVTTAIDKLEKIGLNKVKKELTEHGINEQQLAIVEQYLQLSGSNEDKMAGVKKLLGEQENAQNGLEEIGTILKGLYAENISISFDQTLARGLNYYTGTIVEVSAPEETKMGSLGGGGRYDDLTGLFGVPDIPGVGISFGVDRIYDVMEALDLFPSDAVESIKVLFLNFGEEESKIAYAACRQLRQKGISSELFHEPIKMDKQLKYADKKNITYAVLMGAQELATKTCTIKNLRSRQQETIPLTALADYPF